METGKNKLSGGMRLLAIITSVLMVVIGFYLFFNLRYVVVLFSAAVMVQGVSQILTYLGAKGARNGWDILSGIINILFGAILLFGSVGTRVMGVLTMEMFIALWTLFAGFSHIFQSVGPKKEGGKSRFLTLLGGILLIICGIAFISMPLISSVMMVGIAGIYASVSFIISGVTGLAVALSSGAPVDAGGR